MGSLRVGHDRATSLSLFTFHALEKEMASHSSMLAWRIPGTEEPGGLPSMGSHRVGHDWKRLSSSSILIFNSWITTRYQNKMLTVKEGERNPTYKIVKEQFILVLISQAALSVIFYYNKQNYHMYKYDYYVKAIGNRVTLVKKKKKTHTHRLQAD